MRYMENYKMKLLITAMLLMAASLVTANASSILIADIHVYHKEGSKWYGKTHLNKPNGSIPQSKFKIQDNNSPIPINRVF